MRSTVFIAAGLLWATCAWGVSVDNVRFQQTANDQVVVTYDLEVGQWPVAVELWVSQDGGRTYTMQPYSVSGDVGAEVRSGSGKRIVWDVFSDIRKLEGNAFVFKVVVTGGAIGSGFSTRTGETNPYLDDVFEWEPLAIGSGTSTRTGETEITVNLPGGVKMEFVWIEPGTFMMGSLSSEVGRDIDETQHRVTITQGFYLGKYEITQGQWTAVTGDQPWRGKGYVKENDDHPAVYISWEDVQEFIRRLNAIAGETVYRMPTEAEWEYACRAGTTTRWSFGDNESQLGQYAWYYRNAWSRGLRWGQLVGAKSPNPWGLYDMHGNVWEWVQDWYTSYPGGVVDPTGPSSGFARVMRGGDFDNAAQDLRLADRSKSTPLSRSGYVGARLLRIQ